MIPTRDPRGRVIAFGGRILGAGEPKHLNSPDTPIFDQGSAISNTDRPYPALRRTGRENVGEVYQDVTALAQAGLVESVSQLRKRVTELTNARRGKMCRVNS